MDVYTTLGQGSRAVEVGLDYLRRVGIDWPPHPTEDEARRDYEQVLSLLGSRTIDELIELPLMSDPPPTIVPLEHVAVEETVEPAAALPAKDTGVPITI